MSASRPPLDGFTSGGRPARTELAGRRAGEEAVAAQAAANCTFQDGCGAAAGVAPPRAAALVRNHPCYSEEAHHHFARLHLPVAPGCNIQCHYCNRKFDCAAESRPGVASRRLSPDEAVARVQAVAAEVPELSVVGIAGPGDPLANPAATFATLEGVRRIAPDLVPCLSTNGLALPDHADRIAALGVRHVTVTVNMTDPAVGERIYPWIIWKGRRLRGAEASRVLSDRQLEGIARLAERGILVKVNTVVIPGVNDVHLPSVVRRVRALGAFLVNLVPLISAPEHGTRYGLSGQRGPSPEELEAVQRACAVDARLMRHCRQCRADAVGRLSQRRPAGPDGPRIMATPPPSRDDAAMSPGGSRGGAWLRRAGLLSRAERRLAVEVERGRAERARLEGLRRMPDVPDAPPARIAVATRGEGRVNQHFGHASEFLVYEVSREGAALVCARRVERYCRGGEGEDDALGATLRALAGCRAVLVAKIGRCPAGQLRAAGVEPVTEHAFQPIEAALLAWYRRHVLGREAPRSAPAEVA